ncbi:hypothetical protein [Bacillus sp. AFS040349]|uniref:hypothetical protein n=1 Tax=Bacillus sp. AFS040349 TaxID=2033502 RepID=UPI000BFB21EB|nr:hypothetical protein [Bacillus sp. AFS040349]PGT87406.1 hypothetical protein COD11_07285 [Bacillus sp. AFS040349]
MSSISDNLGQKYFDIEAARVDASPTEIIITNDGSTYFIVNHDELTNELIQQGFKKVENEE